MNTQFQKKLSKCTIVAVSLLVLLTGCSGRTSGQVSEETNHQEVSAIERQEADIYVMDVSKSLKAIDRYSFAESRENILYETLAFDSSSRCYQENGEQISFQQFAELVNDAYAKDHTMKVHIVYQGKIIQEAYL